MEFNLGSTMRSAEAILLHVQSEQLAHDRLAHQDILNLDTHTRLKHMTLHFLKYAGKIAQARINHDVSTLSNVLIDVFIICLATANTLNVSLGANSSITASSLDNFANKLAELTQLDDPFEQALTKLVITSGKMAKSIESTDHLERGNPRAELEDLIVELSMDTLASIGSLKISIQTEIENRWRFVEKKSIFSRLVSQ